MCKICGHAFSTAQSLAAHIDTDHQETEQPEIFQCSNHIGQKAYLSDRLRESLSYSVVLFAIDYSGPTGR